MTLPAARSGDLAACPHGPSCVDGSNNDQVEIDGSNAVTIESRAGCPATNSSVVTGAAAVRINHMPASRLSDRTTDGVIINGSPDVLIGGPSIEMAGAIQAQLEACKEARKTRASGSTAQSYGNCGLESWRNLINKERAAKGLPPVTEDELLAEAQAHGWAANNPGGHDHGAINTPNRLELLKRHGISAEGQPQSIEAIEQATREGKAVSVSVHPYWWGGYVKPEPNDPSSWLHEVAVTGVEYDEHGNIVAFFVNDTGLGICGLRLSVAELDRALEKRGPMTVTEDKAW